MERGLRKKGSGEKASASMFSGGSMVEAFSKSVKLLKLILGCLGLFGEAKSLASVMFTVSMDSSAEEVSTFSGERVPDMMICADSLSYQRWSSVI
jgi:hypothetical protein